MDTGGLRCGGGSEGENCKINYLKRL